MIGVRFKRILIHNSLNLVDNSQEAQSEVAAKLSQSIYWVESILSKCHEEGELLFFTIRTADQPQVRIRWEKIQ